MKGVRFYLDHASKKDKRKGVNEGNVTAVFTDMGYYSQDRWCFAAIGALHYYPNSPVASTAASIEWLRDNGKRISEKEAREIHPELFKRLDEED